MRKTSVLGLAILIVLGISLMMPFAVLAETTTFSPESGLNRTYFLNEGDIIAWEWEVVGDGELDWWIQDSDGNKYEFADEQTSDSGSFVIPEKGDWSVYLWNDNTNPPSIEVDYSIDIEYSKGLPPWAWVLISIACVVGGIALVVSAYREKLPKPRLPPWQSPFQRQPPQPPQQQPQQPPKQPPQQPPSR